jgi:hypothetical protein
VCVKEGTDTVTGIRGDGIILLADEDCSKDLIIDTFGADPTLVSSLAASTNLLYDKVFAAGITTKTNLCGIYIYNPLYTNFGPKFQYIRFHP